MRKRKESERGYFLLEALVITAMLVFATVGLFFIARSAMAIRTAQAEGEATFLAESELARLAAGVESEAGTRETRENGAAYTLSWEKEKADGREEWVITASWNTDSGRERQLVFRREVVHHAGE